MNSTSRIRVQNHCLLFFLIKVDTFVVEYYSKFLVAKCVDKKEAAQWRRCPFRVLYNVVHTFDTPLAIILALCPVERDKDGVGGRTHGHGDVRCQGERYELNSQRVGQTKLVRLISSQ